MEKNEKANTDVMFITKDLDRNAQYYDQKGFSHKIFVWIVLYYLFNRAYIYSAKELETVLNNSGFLIDTLSQDSKESISCLSAVAHTLNVEEPSNARWEWSWHLNVFLLRMLTLLCFLIIQ